MAGQTPICPLFRGMQQNNIAGSANGRLPDSESGHLGSTPSPAVLLSNGCSTQEIVAQTGLSAATISYHRKRLGLSNPIKRIDWVKVQEVYGSGKSYRECKQLFQFSASAWDKAVKRGLLKPRISKKAFQELRSSTNLKNRLLAEGLLENKCYECGQLPWWNNKPLTLQLDHVDGNKRNSKLENLRILCPHCHTQTPTWGRKLRK